MNQAYRKWRRELALIEAGDHLDEAVRLQEAGAMQFRRGRDRLEHPSFDASTAIEDAQGEYDILRRLPKASEVVSFQVGAAHYHRRFRVEMEKCSALERELGTL